MKKILCLFLLLPFLVNCEKEVIYCQNQPKIFQIIIPENSSQYAYFVNDTGKADTQNITVYKLVNNLPMAYDIEIGESKHISIGIFATRVDFYTNKTETIYLKNKAKTYRLDVKGSHLGNEKCGYYGNLLEVSVDGVPQEVNQSDFTLK
ncbi:hypothetical protein [Capnocytophaga sp.]|uniref:hypothetical protein n=1 Tax=Capnocytophaga sp. TaxID=44737 RepID=UPI0026DDA2C6|nr:hypothetical protein [Capnocytophaga sp.]MDO5104549.1 hypothetical protein [Capnocytophaga sp.]